MTEEERTKKVEAARRKYGKPFAHELRVVRQTKHSVVYLDLERKGDEFRRREKKWYP